MAKLTKAQRKMLENGAAKGGIRVWTPAEDRTAESLYLRGLLTTAVGCNADYYVSEAGRAALGERP